MNYSINQDASGIRIDAAVAPASQHKLLDEFAKCAAGTCSCPTPQYEKVQSMDVKAHADGVTVELRVKPGEALDVADIEKCLEHTAKQIGA